MKTEDISLFHRIVEKKSINDTAAQLSIPKSTISRRLKSLEEELSIKLFHRHGREMVPTAAGERFYQQTISMISELENLVSALNTDKAPLSGKLRIQMLPLPNASHLCSLIFSFIDKHPQIDVELLVTTEPLDMVKHNLDVAFRIDIQTEDADLVVRPLFEREVHFYASPAYIEEHGNLFSALDLEKHNCILYRFMSSKVINDTSDFSNLGNIKLKGNLITNSVAFAKMAAIEGKGIACLPNDFVQSQVENGDLIKVLPEIESVKGIYNIVYPSRAYLSRPAKEFIDFVLKEVKNNGFDFTSKSTDEEYWL
ncbi:LysR family transcriptional regulator [Shewanella sp. OPT22]|nr:LysR family transcriptional regulator [Shewanella sp. OPT22]